MNNNARTKLGLGAAGLLAGAVLASTVGASAATSTPRLNSAVTSSSPSTATDPHPGDNGKDGVPEAQEHHDRHHLALSGTVTAVGTSSVTIKTATATEYAVTSASDLDKNGEAALKNLAVGDAVTFSVDSANTKQIDKLHAGDQTNDMPTAPNGSSSSNTSGSSDTSAALVTGA